MHFVMSKANKDRLFVLDYTKKDEKTNKVLYGRIAFLSDNNEKIFHDLKETMTKIAKKQKKLKDKK
mgnify:CR=1 FL=1